MEVTLELCFTGKERRRRSPAEEAAVQKDQSLTQMSVRVCKCFQGWSSHRQARPQHAVLLTAGPAPAAAPRNLSEIQILRLPQDHCHRNSRGAHSKLSLNKPWG